MLLDYPCIIGISRKMYKVLFYSQDHDGRPLKVIFAMRPMNTGPPPPQFDDNTNKLFVGNLAWGVDQSVLEQTFGKHGKVVECKVVTDRETGRSRGFGFVVMSTSAEMERAIAMLDGCVSTYNLQH